jgi:hypothetical protein
MLINNQEQHELHNKNSQPVALLCLALLLMAPGGAEAKLNFRAITGTTTGESPYQAISADFNGDGHPDLATANNADGDNDSVSVLLGKGGGTFQAKQDYAVGNGPFSVVASDLNGDGYLDLVTGNYSDYSISVLLGKGDGTFKAKQDYAVGSAPSSVIASDLNGDGYPDLAISWGDGVAVLLGKGDGTFKARQVYATGSLAYSVLASDLNGDGYLDLATANRVGNSVSVLLGKGDGTFKAKQDYAVGSAPSSVTVSDLNGDGRPDLATANEKDNSVSVLLGKGNGTFKAKQDYAVGDAVTRRSAPRWVTASDLNGDGRPDLVTANQKGNSVSVLLGKGDGTFKAKRDYAVGSAPRSVTASDLNGDGRPDLATANPEDNSVSVLLGKGNGTFNIQSVNGVYRVGSAPNSVAASVAAFVAAFDLNGDGYLDLATANQKDNSVSVLLGKGNGTFNAKQDYAVDIDPNSVAVSDLNGDGHFDLATANWNWDVFDNGSLSILLGKGDGTFQTKQDFSISAPSSLSALSSVVASDLNGDGRPDLITGDIINGSLSVLLGNGDGTFQAKQDYYYVGSDSVAVSDLNGDGHPDLVTNRSLLLGNGDGTFQTKQDYAVGSHPIWAAVSDLNGDSYLDLATVNRNQIGYDSSVSVLLGNGDGTFQTKQDYAVDGVPNWVAASDLNGDGHLDLALANRSSNSVSVLLGNGDGTLQKPKSFGVGHSPCQVAFGDLNGDHKPEVVTANCNSNTVSVLINQSTR